MLSDEEKEIFNNLKDYMQSKIDNGYHKFIYNDLDWDFKCIDCINAIDKVLKQSKEIENLKEQNKNLNWYFENQKDNFVHKDKIKAKIEEYKKLINECPMNDEEIFCKDCTEKCGFNQTIDVLQSLLEKE